MDGKKGWRADNAIHDPRSSPRGGGWTKEDPLSFSHTHTMTLTVVMTGPQPAVPASSRRGLCVCVCVSMCVCPPSPPSRMFDWNTSSIPVLGRGCQTEGRATLFESEAIISSKQHGQLAATAPTARQTTGVVHVPGLFDGRHLTPPGWAVIGWPASRWHREAGAGVMRVDGRGHGTKGKAPEVEVPDAGRPRMGWCRPHALLPRFGGGGPGVAWAGCQTRQVRIVGAKELMARYIIGPAGPSPACLTYRRGLKSHGMTFGLDDMPDTVMTAPAPTGRQV